MKQKMIFLALTLWMLSVASMKAQVTIGSDQDPHEGAILDLSQSARLGLLLPQVFLTNVTSWQLSGNEANGEGMLIYNTNDDVPDGNGKDIYVWIRGSWKPIGPVMLKRFELDKSLLFLDTDNETGTITAQNFTGSDDKPFSSVTVSWSVVAGTVPDDVSISPVDNTFTVTSGSTGSFTVRATAGGVTQDCVVTISGCAGVMDVEGNAYYAAEFGAAGCWMTQNLRTKTYADGETVLTLGADADPASKFYNYPKRDEQIFNDHPEYGLLYTWAAATNRDATSVNEANSSNQIQYQGICPEDWHLPSDYEWNQLEKEIAESAAGVYSISDATTWETGYSTATESRGTHGKKMKSTTTVDSHVTNGTSKSHSGGGFDALLVGGVSGLNVHYYSQLTDFWSSSSHNSSTAYHRYIGYTDFGVHRYSYYKYILYSVRCKKNDN
ncbi:MAG: fibrobacter succinogenes major paralogous domain-containing protein [Dysgonamonadaceae bacterium]|jgi:uncharacterized protein (TIGR02145 family)|nr:fibrobacter succinogenes major paralogous domain-containing protein [Dysgonamonadaceae bacterium]